MSPEPSGEYRIEASDEVWDALAKMPEGRADKVFRFWQGHLRHTPTRRIPGIVKELKGEYKGAYQFDVSRELRMIYWVDEAEQTVYIEYLGPHPDWSKRRPY